MIRLLAALWHRLCGRDVCPKCGRPLPPTTRLRFAGFDRDGHSTYACSDCVGWQRIILQARREAW